MRIGERERGRERVDVREKTDRMFITLDRKFITLDRKFITYSHDRQPLPTWPSHGLTYRKCIVTP